MDTSNASAEVATREVVITRVFAAPRTLVFQAWTNPAMLIRWFGPRDFSVTVIESDVRTGGAYDFHVRGPSYDDHWKGIYREVLPPERLVFTWPAGPNSIVTVTFEDLGGQTRLTLHHGVFETGDARDRHEHGWNSTLDCLADYLQVAHE